MQELFNRLTDKDKALFKGLSPDDRSRFLAYLFSEPRAPEATPNMRSRALALYDPFCDRRNYPLGILWSCAPYSFCSHWCAYCYGRSYLHQFMGGAKEKKGFRKTLIRDLLHMAELQLPARHFSMSNSSDVLMDTLETELRHTLFMLESLVDFKRLVKSCAILTKNPAMLLTDEGYISACQSLDLEVQVSLAFHRESVRKDVEPGAPSVDCRKAAIEELVKQGIRVALRIDPLFPYAAREKFQSRDDLVALTEWAASAGVSYVISSPLKLPFRRNVEKEFNSQLAGSFTNTRGSYKRMPNSEQAKLLAEMKELCSDNGLSMEHCFLNILKRNSSITTTRSEA